MLPHGKVAHAVATDRCELPPADRADDAGGRAARAFALGGGIEEPAGGSSSPSPPQMISSMTSLSS